MDKFYKRISLKLTKSMFNYYPDNFDTEIRQIAWRNRSKLLFESIINWLIRLLKKNVFFIVGSSNNFYLQNLNKFEQTFNLLADEESKEKYVELLAYKALGFTKVKLSLNNENYWISRSNVGLYRKNDNISVNFRSGHLNLFDLADAGYELKLYFVENGIFVDFILQQYNYADLVSVCKGDIVIDAGGCWGDTALYFAAKGADKVFVFEFIPSNIEILKANLELNSQYAKHIVLVKSAVWEDSDIHLSFDDRGPASRVARFGEFSAKTRTLAIDDLVTRYCLERVDFIKMDIEGAEMHALRGAAEAIRKYKPKLAISAYHNADDLVLIPEYIRSLNPDYLFYLDYYTIIGDEIVLYAIDPNHA